MKARGKLVALVATAAMLGATGMAEAKMRSAKLADGTCMTTGGGRIVDIPWFPGEQIDGRILRDVRWLKRRFRIHVTDGYSRDRVHAANGEHPLGLALDIVPDKTKGGTWRDIGRLARWAEPRRDRPRPPFRWVGYKGDANHGPRNHLHLSWNHSTTRPGVIPRTVYSVRCPKPTLPLPPPPPIAPPGTIEPAPLPPSVTPQSGGIGAKPLKRPVRETGGISLR